MLNQGGPTRGKRDRGERDSPPESSSTAQSRAEKPADSRAHTQQYMVQQSNTFFFKYIGGIILGIYTYDTAAYLWGGYSTRSPTRYLCMYTTVLL